MGGAASQTAAPPRPWQPRAPPDRARHHPARAGPARPGPHPPAEGAVAVVGPAPWTWTFSGGRTSAGSTWSTPSGLPNRLSAGRSRALARPSRPTAGPGWCWPPTPSSAWPARSPATSGCRGSGPDPSRGCHRCECGAGFRGCCARSTRRPPHRNPPDAPPAGPRAGPPGPRSATLRLRSRPTSPETGRPGPHELPDRLSPSSSPADLGRRSARHPPG